MRIRVTFDTFPATSVSNFTCPKCGKAKRKRTFRAECTVNPFNKNDDGSIKTPSEVRKQSFEKADKERQQFEREPLCTTCEVELSYKERIALGKRRRGEE